MGTTKAKIKTGLVFVLLTVGAVVLTLSQQKSHTTKNQVKYVAPGAATAKEETPKKSWFGDLFSSKDKEAVNVQAPPPAAKPYVPPVAVAPAPVVAAPATSPAVVEPVPTPQVTAVAVPPVVAVAPAKPATTTTAAPAQAPAKTTSPAPKKAKAEPTPDLDKLVNGLDGILKK